MVLCSYPNIILRRPLNQTERINLCNFGGQLACVNTNLVFFMIQIYSSQKVLFEFDRVKVTDRLDILVSQIPYWSLEAKQKGSD